MVEVTSEGKGTLARFLQVVLIWALIGVSSAFGDPPLLGPAPNGAAGDGLYSPPLPPNNAAPGGFGDQNGTSGANGSGNQSRPNQKEQNGLGPPSVNGNGLGTPTGQPQPQGPVQTNAPTFMNGSMPNTTNPFLPNNISPGLNSGPLQNAYLQSGVPALAAPLMSVVYRPFGLTYFQPNPFQITPQGAVSLTGTFEEDTNINYSPNNPESGSLFTISPAIYYSNFDDYGYVSLLGDISYFQYNQGNIPSYLDEMAGVSAGTYLGTRIFVGGQDFLNGGSTPQMTGSPFGFFNGINPYYENLADAEIGVALTPQLTFVQGASDMYFDMSGYGAGIMNIQSLTDTLNYMDRLDFLSASYVYQQGIITLFPSFISNGVNGTAMRSFSKTFSGGLGGSASYYFFQNDPSINFEMFSYYGLLTHQFSRSISASLEGGWNVASFVGQTYQNPLIDLNVGYTGARLSLGINLGEYMLNGISYGIETGPEQTYDAIGYLSYVLGPKTSLYSSAGYSYYQFLSISNFSNNFFQTLQPNINYNGTMFDQEDGISYRPFPWLTTSLTYNLIAFSSNIPNETVIDNQFIGLISFMWNFL